MKKALRISLCMIALMAFAMWAPDASAFNFYSDATNDQGGCAQCHTGFRDNGNYFSNAEGVSWGDSLHNVHLNNTNIDSNCGNCHFGAGTAGRTVNLGSSEAAADGVNAIACSGCHGRLEDANTVTTTGTGWGAGLRQHHFVNGETICLGCHEDADPAAFTVAGEDVMPPFYGSIINDNRGTNLESCNAVGEENLALAGDPIGLDNDGDNSYDTADSDCAQPAGPTLEIPGQVPADSNGPVTVPVSYTANGNDISSMIFSVDFDENNLVFDPASTMGFPWPDAISVNPLISPFVFSVGITYDATDTDGELDFSFSDINLPLAALPEGDIVTITFTAGNPTVDTNAPVAFSLDPPASFGNTAGESVPGITVDGSVLINIICTPTGAEVCDNIDNDCNGLVDDNLTRSTTCGLGECGATGQETCTAGVWGNNTCTPGTPTAEVCDNLDNDCNGFIDNNLTRTTTCGIGECAGNTGLETCTAGTWSGDTCDPVSGATAEVCDNLDNDCDGTTDENLTRPTTCGTGECAATGEETCSAGIWGGDTCTPGTPSAEVCDNLDNDCDGAIDDNLTRPTTCGVGECGATGEETCSAGTWGGDTCTPGTPSAEVCDNLDNDCDGSTDENLTRPTTCGTGECAATGEETCSAGTWDNDTCTPGTPSAEVCDNLDNDCDGSTDENLSRPTTCGTGECGATGQETCSAGTWGNDTCTPGTPSAEVCEGVLDENCDGAVDEGCDCIANIETRPCGSDVGECVPGIETCGSDGLWSGTCVGDVGPSAEVCDNLDNDCDGSTDENLSRPSTCGTGECGATGEETCSAGVWGNDTCTPGTPSAEICDNLDNDCNGSVDDNLTRPTTCGVGECGATGEETCSAGTWGGDTCTPGTPSAEICDNLDNDCDGSTDENLTRPTTCGVGECGATGEETCSAGTWGNDTCTPDAPSAEVCDNLDNDCDGSTDENLTRSTTCGVGECGATGQETCSAGTWGGDTCTPGTPSAEVCDNLDNDCDGAIDDNLTRPTTCGLGECGATGEETCSAGMWSNDTCTPGTPSPEVCDGFLDENCDGVVDEACDCVADIQTRDCGSDVGECVIGTETCGSDGKWSGICVNEVGPTAEVCDNLDNDCDGSTDENLSRATTCGTGECGATGQETCSAGIWGNDTCTPGTPSAEICDNLDNDCDGSTDENLTRPTTCGVGECGATGEETCSAGMWGGDTCTPGTPSAEVCDNLDNDCDGSTDENLTRPTTCGVGECGATGEETCSTGTWGGDTCTPGTPSAEVCDNLDNDCDGAIDENLTRPSTCGVGECGATGEETCTAGMWGGDTCTPGTPSAEVCDNLDNDCDGATDENLTQPSTCGIGECAATGMETCSAGIWGNDTCTPGTPGVEGPIGDPTCSDTLDNDCDGMNDAADIDCQSGIPFDQLDDFIGLPDGTRPNFGNWTGVNGSDGTMGWVALSGATGSGSTGPAAGNPDPYVYLESSGSGQTYGVDVTAGSSQYLISNNIDASQYSSLSLSFDWNMNVDDNADASLHVDIWNGSGWDLDVTGSAINTGNNSDVWITEGPIDLSGYSNSDFQIRIRYIVGTGTIYANDVAVDNLHISGTTSGSGECTNGQTQPCGATDVGECEFGTQTCSGGSWGACIGNIEPAAETCDNLDNDCDGATDEMLTRPSTCGSGECGATGQETCSAGMWGNDTCTPGTPSAEICDDLDNDCDGSIDENLSRPTTCGIGECGATGQETCSAGMWGNDTCIPGTPSAEVCDDLDNDCDGTTDENLTRPTTCGVGECGATGQETCSAGMWGGDTCTPGTPSAEICDNLDNDCDGSTDENLIRPTTCGLGECAGNTGDETCTAGMWGGDTCDPFAGALPEGPPGDATCGDTLDNDCDGATDNGDSDCQENIETNCFDGIDNDGDGLTDCEDAADCDGATDGACSTANACTTGTRTCQGGAEVCVASNVPDGTACGDASDTECDNPDSCQAGTCVPNFEPSTVPCDDGAFCNGADTCNGSGVCTGGESPCQQGEFCDEANDVCEPPAECYQDADCNDGLFCNGVETCDVNGQCQPGTDPCQPGEYCWEANQSCQNQPPECITDADCDDGLFCNGVEICDNDQCQPGENPCPSCNLCDESQDTCFEPIFDLDINSFIVGGSRDKRNKVKKKSGGSASVGKPIRRIQLAVGNPNGSCEQAAPATVTGVQDGKTVYNETRMVWDLGTGKGRFAFPVYTPIKKGDIIWTAEIFDDDPDNDTATVTTRVK